MGFSDSIYKNTSRGDTSEYLALQNRSFKALDVRYSGGSSSLACPSASLAAFSSASTTSTSSGNVRMAAIPVSWLSSV